MKQFSITQLLLAITWVGIVLVFAVPFFAKQPLVERTVDLKDMTIQDFGYLTRFSSEQIANSPQWNPTAPNPPLSAASALAVAEEFRNDQLADSDSQFSIDTRWKLKKLSLQALDSQTNKWCWVAAFQQLKPQSQFMSEVKERSIFIDMNGNIFPPKKRDNLPSSIVPIKSTSGSNTSGSNTSGSNTSGASLSESTPSPFPSPFESSDQGQFVPQAEPGTTPLRISPIIPTEIE